MQPIQYDQQKYEEALKAWAEGAPIMSDLEFDILEEKVNPSMGIPGEYDLPIQMWSIGKTNVKPLYNNYKCIVQYKIDGVSVLLHYKMGRLIGAYTRGDGFCGQSVYHHAKYMPIPRELPYREGDVYIIGEAFITKYDAERMGFKNARNGVAGLLNRKEAGSEPTYIEFMAFQAKGDVHCTSETDQLRLLKSWEFDIPKTSYNFKNLESVNRDELPYLIDGLVVKVNSHATQEKLGYTNHHPRFYAAHKFVAAENTTIIKDIEWQIGRTGVLIPVAILEPLDMDGSTISKATLHSHNRVLETDIAPGDLVLIKKAGDIIPYVAGIVEKGDIHYGSPMDCPSCQKALFIDGAHLKCEYNRCPKQCELQFTYACKTMGIKGIGPKSAEILLKSSGYTTLTETINFAFFTAAGRFPESVPMWKAIQACNSEGLGKAASQRAVKEGKTLHNYMNQKDADDLIDLLNII